MPTQFIRRSSVAGSRWTGSNAGIGVDSDDNRLYVNTDGTRRPVNTASVLALVAARTLLASESGAVITLDATTEFDVILPAAAAGLHFLFVVKSAPSGANYTVTAATADTIFGQVLTNDFSGTNDSDFEASGGDAVEFVTAKAVKGDWAEFFCDGTDWYVRAGCSVFDAIIISG